MTFEYRPLSSSHSARDEDDESYALEQFARLVTSQARDGWRLASFAVTRDYRSNDIQFLSLLEKER
jgi:hypothetical protein